MAGANEKDFCRVIFRYHSKYTIIRRILISLSVPLLLSQRMSVVNLFELSRNFNRKDQAWLMDKYIQQQEPLQNVQGTAPHTPAPTLTQTPFNDPQQCVREGTPAKEKDRQAET